MENYFDERNRKNIIQIRKICDGLPVMVREFDMGIQQRTSTLTRLGYVRDLKIFFQYLAEDSSKDIKDFTIDDIKNITSFDIELFLDYLSNYKIDGKNHSCGERAKERKLCTLRSFFKYFYKKNMLPENVTAKVDLPKIHDKGIIRLEPDEIVKLLNLVESEDVPGMTPQQKAYHAKTRVRDFAILSLFLGTGIRISELVGINKKDVDFKNNAFTVTRKGGNKSILYFSEEVRNALLQYGQWCQEQINANTEFGNKIVGNPALFFSSEGKRITVRAVENMVVKYTKIVCPLKKITPHKLRSTYGTELYRQTKDIYIVADVLGHKDINTTRKHYAAISDDIRREAATKVKLRDVDDD